MWDDWIEPLQSKSLKEVFVTRFEALILSGKIRIGQKLPPERELARQLGVSRPVVHEGLVELSARGLVTLKPRYGATVNDYRKEGSVTLLSSLIHYHKGMLDPALLNSLLQMRLLLETEFSRFAARKVSALQLTEFRDILDREQAASPEDIETLTDLDFQFHLLIGLATGNAVYPLLLNSFRQVYTNLTSLFFKDAGVIATVHRYHRDMVAALANRDPDRAADVMKSILRHGEKHLLKRIGERAAREGQTQE